MVEVAIEEDKGSNNMNNKRELKTYLRSGKQRWVIIYIVLK